jgi:hypothetical protein
MVAQLTKEDVEAQKSAQFSAEIEPELPETEVIEKPETEIIEPESPQPSGYTITKFQSESEDAQASTVSIANENEEQLVTEVFDTTASVESDSDRGNLSKGIENCSGAAHKAVTPFEARFDNRFSLFQLLKTMLAIYGFYSEN